MTLRNGDFELAATGDAAHRALVLTPNKAGQASYWTQRGEINNPDGWTAWYVHSEGEPPEHDPSNPNGWCEPETRSAPHKDPDRMHGGTTGHVMFTFYRIHQGGYFQQAPAVVGKRYEFSYWAHAWTGNSDDPNVSEPGSGPLTWWIDDGASGAQLQASFEAGIDPTGGTDPEADTVVWGEALFIYNVYAQVPAVEAVAQSDTITVFTRETMLWPYKHCDGYIDDADLVQLVDPEPEPEPECRGLPREDYARTYWLLSQAATQAQVQRALTLAYATRGTVGFSADDAGIGDLDNREVRVLWFAPTDWDRDALDAFFAEWYPGVTVIHEYIDTAPPVEPPTGGEPTPPYQLRSPNLIGLHSSYVGAQSWPYIEQGLPTVQKFFSAGDCYSAKRRAPELVSVWRKHESSLPAGTPREQAVWYVGQYEAEIKTAASNMGLTVAALLDGIDAVESYNEMVPSNNPAAITTAVDFDVEFADQLYRRFSDGVAPVLLNVAVGNPYESEVPLLLPAADAAEFYDGWLGYHAYWAANRERSYLADGWQWHAGRWCEWDKVFTAHGLYPRYLSTEAGRCYSPDGKWMNPALGWKSCGSFESYLVDIAEFNARVLAWNATHANRFTGAVIFCAYQYGWADFELGSGDVELLTKWGQAL